MADIAIQCGDRTLISGAKTLVMGVINVTPDSFSDGGHFLDLIKASEHGLTLIADGADIIDIGGLATSSYLSARPVDEEEELRRVIPVIEKLASSGITNISIDTMRARVAEYALSAGAAWINDQSAGLFDEKMPSAMAKAQGVVIMHDGGGKTSGVHAGEQIIYEDVINQIYSFFSERIKVLEKASVDPGRIIVDPGIGFGKGLSDSLTIINNVHSFKGLASMTLLGLSRKSFIGKMTGIKIPGDRDFATLGAHAAAIFSGVNILRTHNVRATVEMASVLDGCLRRKTKADDHENLYQTRR
jgi:dihydropteroate synthase